MIRAGLSQFFITVFFYDMEMFLLMFIILAAFPCHCKDLAGSHHCTIGTFCNPVGFRSLVIKKVFGLKFCLLKSLSTFVQMSKEH